MFPFMIRRKARSSLDVDVFSQCPRSPWVRLLVSRPLHRTFQMAPCDTPVIIEISLWESPWPENRTITSIITCRILVSMLAILVWSGNLHTATAYMQLNAINTNATHRLWGNWEISTPVKKTDRDCKSAGRPWNFVRGLREVLYIDSVNF